MPRYEFVISYQPVGTRGLTWALGGVIMSQSSQLEPWCSRLLSPEELSSFLARSIRMHDNIACSPFADSPTSRLSVDEADFYRTVRWSIDPSIDKAWVMTVPPDNPEFIQGSCYFVVVRNGNVIAKHQLFAL